MHKKQINKEIRRISTFSSLPLLIFMVLETAGQFVSSYLVDYLEDRCIPVDRDYLKLIMYTVLYAILFFGSTLLFYAIRRKKTGLQLHRVFRKPQMSWGWILKWFVIAYSLVTSANVLTKIATYIFESQTRIELFEPSFEFGGTPIAIFTLFLAVSVYAPFFEELFFRGTLYRHNEVLGQFFSLMICGLSFGLWHTNYDQLFYTMAMGCVMAFIFLKTRSVWPVILFHFLMNTYSAVITLIYPHIGRLPDTAPPVILFFVITFLLMFVLWQAGIVLMILEFALKKNRDRNKLRKGVFRIGGFKKLLVYFSAPVTIIAYLFMIVMTTLNAIH